MAKVTASSTIKLTLKLDESLYDTYAERATKFGRTVEDELQRRLNTCQSHTATSPIYLDDAQRSELTQLSGYLLRTGDDVTKWAREMVTLKVDGIEIPISTTLAKRLATRTFGLPRDEFIRKIVTEQLEAYVGLR